METSAEPILGRERTCRHCGKTGREGEAFYAHQGNMCKECAKRAKIAWQRAVQEEGGERHERRKDQMRIAQATTKYGLTKEEARALYEVQLCQICGRPNDRGYRLNIDHCHATGKARGVLCNRCNRGIGFFLDDPELLDAAALYLRGHGGRGSGAHRVGDHAWGARDQSVAGMAGSAGA